MRTSLLTATLIALLSFPSAAEARRVRQAYLDVSGPFETVEELRAACKDAVGASDEVNRKNAHITMNDRTETYFVNRCVQLYNKKVENEKAGQRHYARTTRRASRLNERAAADRTAQEYRIKRSANNNLRARARQVTFSRRRASRSLQNIRPEERRSVRTRERTATNLREARRMARREANTFCAGSKGLERVNCRNDKEKELLAEWEAKMNDE